MNYPGIRIEGSIFSPDIFDKLEDATGQKSTDFGFDSNVKVKDEIVRAWADAQDYRRIFKRKLETLKADSTAVTETRSLWIVPLLGLLGWQLEYQPKGTEVNGKNYLISHKALNRAEFAVHINGFQDQAGLDRKSEKTPLRMSAHAMVQEYLNLSEQLYGIVTNGHLLRLLRDSSRLVKLTYLEFDLDRIFDDGLFADFAVLYRLLHVTRLPVSPETSAESIVERYHQDSLDSGARIREGLSKAVEQAILGFGNGFLNHPDNLNLRKQITDGKVLPLEFYQKLLHLIYRTLFLFVIEERHLVFPLSTPAKQKDLYDRFYSLRRLRFLSEKNYLADRRKSDLWLAMLACFKLFEADGPGAKLGIAPLAGDLFDEQSIDIISRCSLSNDVLLTCLRWLNVYENEETRQTIRVNYASLNVEEFGSVYEGLLEYEPIFVPKDSGFEFAFKQGDDRAATGSHYTPDDLVQPLIKNSLEYLISDKKRENDPEKALLSLRVADISCGSGHILLAAARRIATELAIVRTGEEQPSPSAFRTAVRDVIRECIYGVDLNPLAVELCKVALWLEAHNPGEPLNFLDHHIKCGNAIVGFVYREELDKGVPDEAFIFQSIDDKDIASQYRKKNKLERENKNQTTISLSTSLQKQLKDVLTSWKEISELPERIPSEIEVKKNKYNEFTKNQNSWMLGQVAAVPIAQFFISKTGKNSKKIITDEEYRLYLSGERTLQGQGTAAAWVSSINHRFFHWFLEFPEIIERGGFDCILGNPPFLGNRALSGTFGYAFLNWVKYEYAPAGSVDLVTYFFRRIFELIRPNGFMALISTNTIAQGAAREGGLEFILNHGGEINFAIRSMRWPGRASVEISLISLKKGKWTERFILNGNPVSNITAYLDSADKDEKPIPLLENIDKSFQGSIILGTGFFLSQNEAKKLIQKSPKLKDVIFPHINGYDLNSSPEQIGSRWVINFFDWAEEKCRNEYLEAYSIVEERVKPERTRKDEYGKYVLRKPLPERWWIYADKRPKLYSLIKDLPRVLVIAQVSKTVAFAFISPKQVLDAKLIVFPLDQARYFAVLQSSLHYHWAWRYCTTMKADLSYVPSAIFTTFPFPVLSVQQTESLNSVGELYHEKRSLIMHRLCLGLTDIYNLLHKKELTPEMVDKSSKKPEEATTGYKALIELRELHKEMDEIVINSYGWSDLALKHDFYEVETLPENDRVRYTIHPDCRKELLKRLLALNHKRAETQAVAIPEKKMKKAKGFEFTSPAGQPDLFS